VFFKLETVLGELVNGDAVPNRPDVAPHEPGERKLKERHKPRESGAPFCFVDEGTDEGAESGSNDVCNQDDLVPRRIHGDNCFVADHHNIYFFIIY